MPADTAPARAGVPVEEARVTLIDQVWAWGLSYAAQVMSSPEQVVAHIGAAIGVVLAAVAALVRTMVPLRWLAVGSNVGLLVFGVLHPSPTTAAVAVILLPINVYRAVEIMRLTKRVRQATEGSEMAAIWLKPYMKPRKLRAGRILFRKGDRANRLYLLTEGEAEVVELGERLPTGRMFGEVALFTANRERTATVRAVTDCRLLWIHESTVRQLYYQNPAFGFHLIELLASRKHSTAAMPDAHASDGGRTVPASMLSFLHERTRPMWRPPMQPPAPQAPAQPPAPG